MPARDRGGAAGAGGMSDVCIVGGGVIGLALAYELAERGREVTVLEAGALGERSAAGVAAGMIAPYAEADVAPGPLTRLALESHRRYPEFIARLEARTGMDTGFDRTGTLVVAAHRDHRAPLLQLEAFQKERGLAARRVSAEEVRQLEPLLGPAVGGGLLLEADWQIDPRRLLRALLHGLTGLGGTFVDHAEVTGFRETDGGHEVTYRKDGEACRLVAGQLVLAAGAWTGGLAGEAVRLPMRPVRGEILRLRGERLFRHVVRSPAVYLVPRADGELVVGATAEERGFDARVRAGAVHELLREAVRVSPAIEELELAECSVGFRPALRDHLPAIGAVGERLFVATGHYRNGVELAPVTAELLAGLLCDGCMDPLLEPFAPGRFAVQGAAGVEART